MSDKGKKEEVVITAFLNIFDQKLNRLKKDIKKEFDKPKKERNKDNIKKWLREAKRLRKRIKEAKRTVKAVKVHCPHCGEHFDFIQ